MLRKTCEDRGNEIAWNTHAYEAWLNRYGTPGQAALRIRRDPMGRLGALAPYFADVKGKNIANLLGSHGSKAVALALLGANVTVVDLSEENRRYAKELAAAAGVGISYVVADVLDMPPGEQGREYDVVFAEQGILHYFTDLSPFFGVCKGLLSPGGSLIIQDFHPVSTKLIVSTGTTINIRKHKVKGDYFDTGLEESEVAFAKYLPLHLRPTLPRTYLRKWTLGEIVTSVAGVGLFIESLVEEGNLTELDKGIPKTFTLVARKLTATGSGLGQGH